MDTATIISAAEINRKATLWFGKYLRWLIAFPAVLYVLPFFLLRLPGFESWGGSPFAPAIEYGFEAAGQNADVVIVGDSGAMIGLDPVQMSRDLGLKAINLPNTAGSLPVIGEIELDSYLRHNKAPHMIVAYLSPWSLDFSHEQSIPLIYEGEEALAAHGAPKQIMAFVKTHRMDLLLFPFRFYSVNPPAAARALLLKKSRTAAVAAAQGHFDPMSQHAAMSDATCALPEFLAVPGATDSAREFLQKYSSASTKVLIFIAPIPSCSNTGALLSRSYAEIAAAPPRLMPPTSFKADGSFDHLVPSAVPATTATLTNAVRAGLSSAAVPDAR